MTKPTHFQNHAPSRKRVPSQPEAGFFHHINGVFAPETVASARIGGWTLICLKSAPVPKIITRVIKPGLLRVCGVVRCLPDILA
jgi:hypothetical protein